MRSLIKHNTKELFSSIALIAQIVAAIELMTPIWISVETPENSKLSFLSRHGNATWNTNRVSLLLHIYLENNPYCFVIL